MNAKLAKKLRKNQRKAMMNVPEEVDQAIEKAFLMGVQVGMEKQRRIYEGSNHE